MNASATTRKKFYIKERQNPQTGTYYKAMGQMSAKDAKMHEKTLYGFNVMHSYASDEAYANALSDLRKQGNRVV